MYGYGYAPYHPNLAASAHPVVGYPLQVWPNAQIVFGADATAPDATQPPQTFADKASAALNKETFGVKNKYIGAGAIAIALIAYGVKAGAFGK